MTNIAATIRHNQSKHQATTQETATGINIDQISLTRMGIMFKEYETVTGAHRQSEIYSLFRRFLNRARDNNLFARISDGTYPDGLRIRGQLDASSSSDIIVENASGGWWGAADDGDLVLQIGGEAGWVQDGSTLEMDTLGERLFMQFRETFLKKM